MASLSHRLDTVEQLLHYLREARRGESELLMKEVWEHCHTMSELRETELELELVIAFLEQRKLELAGGKEG